VPGKPPARVAARDPEQLFDVTLQPIVFLLLFVYLFGGAITDSQHDYLQYVLPGPPRSPGLRACAAGDHRPAAGGAASDAARRKKACSSAPACSTCSAEGTAVR
jgi:hypothetical protein